MAPRRAGSNAVAVAQTGAPMSAPFRDLFVELPQALLEVLQGIGEAAVYRCTEKRIDDAIARSVEPRRVPRLLSFLRNPGPRRMLAEMFGWLDLNEPLHAAMEPAVELRVIRACGHQTWAIISERTLESLDDLKPHAALDELVRLLLRHHERGRRCTCILQQKAAT